ncbi:GlxA family transcriptional regulator [Tropicibacter sp. R15_0]|uniref:GlxA family transcriptional regulator n=1 Tax=Tropicibacter sp. R15_0 TaxID=2821101 RepID=UPI001ADCF65A|nr:GlxA family transcriptional regulator [Tropicibacter sp. R15_0]MBO9468352.1 GlxA family transcriptional regulator [Tropicibacter sp. R15_0]
MQTKTQHFIFALVEEFTHLAFSCAVEPLRIANLVAEKPLYSWGFASEDGERAMSSMGAVTLVDHSFAALPACDRLFVLSGINMQKRDHKGLIAALRRLDRTSRTRIGALCSGAYVLAKAGFLEDRRAAIHWEYHDTMFEEFPEVNTLRSVFVDDEKYVTASGGTATADLMLHVIEQDHGADLSLAVADQMVYNAVREAGSDQKLSLQSRNGIRNPHLARAIEIMRDNLAEPVSPIMIADDLGISTRQVERVFGKYLNTSPKKYYMELRLERARHLLVQTELSVIEIAIACGFSSPGHFSRVYRTHFGVSPVTQRGKLG